MGCGFCFFLFCVFGLIVGVFMCLCVGERERWKEGVLGDIYK